MSVEFNRDILDSINDYIESIDDFTTNELIEYLRMILTPIYNDKYILDDILYQYIYKILYPENKRFNFNPTTEQYNEYKIIPKKLLELPQFEQRSEGWYADRYNKITASPTKIEDQMRYLTMTCHQKNAKNVK